MQYIYEDSKNHGDAFSSLKVLIINRWKSPNINKYDVKGSREVQGALNSHTIKGSLSSSGREKAGQGSQY